MNSRHFRAFALWYARNECMECFFYPSRSKTPRPICVEQTIKLRLYMKNPLQNVISIRLRVRYVKLPTNFRRKKRKKEYTKSGAKIILVASDHNKLITARSSPGNIALQDGAYIIQKAWESQRHACILIPEQMGGCWQRIQTGNAWSHARDSNSLIPTSTHYALYANFPWLVLRVATSLEMTEIFSASSIVRARAASKFWKVYVLKWLVI